ncbi:MAG: Isocitrate dehydrogenase [NADP] [Aureobasidium pullulans]|nr:MAG: Isocitrate dehydrogenase [NADP] [Aureobasidium pullulans]
MSFTNDYPKDQRSKAGRYAKRVTYDKDAVRKIVDAAPILHVSFNAPMSESMDAQFPTILPMLGAMASSAEDDQVVYLHGSSAARLFRLDSGQEDPGLPVCIAATLLDGYVLALTPFNHSCNYRSAVVFGHATKVTNTDETMRAMELITNHLITDRWTNSRTLPTRSELTATGILKVRIETASVKVRNGGPHDDRKDLKDDATTSRVWTGVVPVQQVLGEAIASPENLVKQIPGSVTSWIEDTNSMRKDDMLKSMKE